MEMLRTRIPGIILAAVLAMPAWLIGNAVPIVGSPIIGIVLGLLLAFWRRPEWLQEGLSFTGKKILQYSIVLMGFGLNLLNVVHVGGQTLELMIFTLTASFLTAFFVGKWLGVEGKTQTLIGVGTSICGGSAIAATAPVIKADGQEVAHAISTIFLFNILAAFLFPFVGHLLGMDAHTFGLWAGTAINDTSSVVAAGYSFSHAAGNFAVIVKLTRTLMIIPVTLFLAIYTSRKTTGADKGNYHLSKIFPWFVLGFLLASIISTVLPLPAALVGSLVLIGKYMIIMAMVSIGLNTNLIALVRSGVRPILLGFICWLVLSLTSLAAQYWIL